MGVTVVVVVAGVVVFLVVSVAALCAERLVVSIAC